MDWNRFGLIFPSCTIYFKSLKRHNEANCFHFSYTASHEIYPQLFKNDKEPWICYPTEFDWMWEMVKLPLKKKRSSRSGERLKQEPSFFTHFTSLAFLLLSWKDVFLFSLEKNYTTAHIWGALLFNLLFFYHLPSGYFPAKVSVRVSFISFSLCYCAAACVCRTSKTNWHTFAAKCTCSSDYQLACVQQWLMGGWWTQTRSWHFPALWLKERGGVQVSVRV